MRRAKLVGVAHARVDVAVALGLGVREGLTWYAKVNVASAIWGADTVAVAEMITNNNNIAHAPSCASMRVEIPSGLDDL